MCEKLIELPGQRKLFGPDDSEEQNKIENRLRELARKWGATPFDDCPPIVAEINAITSEMEVHPWWWGIPYCECAECRERAEFFSQ